MEIFRNKTVRGMLFWFVLILVLSQVLALALPRASRVILLLSGLALASVFFSYTASRYKKIALLSEYLRRVNQGEASLDVPDNEEGELSILKSEILKATVAQKTQTELLRQEKVRLAQALSDISHQFKTPLTSMSLMTDLLSEDDLDSPRRTEFATQMRTQIERLAWLTESLLKISRLDAGAVSFSPRLVPARDLVDKALSSLVIPMELKEQRLFVDAQGELWCDRNWTAEALSNILKNSVEHTPVGGEIRVVASGNPLFFEIAISDDGPGIPRAEVARVFQRFYRGKGAAKGSVGIGLSMSKAVAEAQGGTLELVHSPAGETVWRMRFPPKGGAVTE